MWLPGNESDTGFVERKKGLRRHVLGVVNVHGNSLAIDAPRRLAIDLGGETQC